VESPAAGGYARTVRTRVLTICRRSGLSSLSRTTMLVSASGIEALKD
jgi:hypothetical protein